MVGEVYRSCVAGEAIRPGQIVGMYRGRVYAADRVERFHRDRRGRRWSKWVRAVPCGMAMGLAMRSDPVAVMVRGAALVTLGP